MGQDRAVPTASSPRRRVVLVVHPDLQSLDLTGPAEVFAAAGGYELTVVAVEPGWVTTTSGLRVAVDCTLDEVAGPIDTLVVVGGDGTREAVVDEALLAGIVRLSAVARRTASVCSGAFVLAAAGLLDGRRATTHWSVCELLATKFPTVEVDPDPIYVRDGDVWTSAGVTAGMDLALALVEDDLGREVALRVARGLVLFLHRPGNQRQFSTQLDAQLADRNALRDLQAFIVDHPDADLTVAGLARRAGMSDRNLARCFHREVGITPARYVERVRVEAARRRLEDTDDAIEVVAATCGFGTPETLRRTFLRAVRTTPTEYRRRFRTAASERSTDFVALRPIPGGSAPRLPARPAVDRRSSTTPLFLRKP
ncbi:MAG: DJ-1/PfpI family protein [Acidimicrobiia bacterium]|nr:DJ-1/PfpI family protein [Acidimicrobiia bacterium]